MRIKRGFTLIELLAVIVILAVIALIATPIVLSILTRVRKSAFQDSAYGIMEAAKSYFAETILEEVDPVDQVFSFEEGAINELSYSGSKPKGGILTLSRNGEIALAIHNNEWCAIKSKTDTSVKLIKYEKEKCVIPDGAKDPIITLNGEKEITLNVGDIYSEEGAIAKTVDGTELAYTTEIKKDSEKVESIDTNEEGTYTIIYKVTSNNKESTVVRIVVIKQTEAIWIRADSNNHGVSGGVPTLSNGLIPVKNLTKEDKTTKWYDYDIQMWANAVSVKEEYRSVEVGERIPEEAILAYFVWIPRYEYMYTNLGTQYAGGTQEQPGEISVNFIEKNQISPSDSDNYKIHPAFTFGNQELSGIWVGKFATSAAFNSSCYQYWSKNYCNNANQQPYIKPNVKTLQNQIVSNQFVTAQKFSVTGNIYGINAGADAHMMKNSEWGAIAYLSQSRYGKYGNNNYSGANKEVYASYNITGWSSGSPGYVLSNGKSYKYNDGLKGMGASTTGTIYGVYDMVALMETVMAVYRGSDANSTWGGIVWDGNSVLAAGQANLAGFSSIPEKKYYDEYITSNMETACNNGICYGHALSETSGWYFDVVSTNLVRKDDPWLARGANYQKNATGIFNTFRGQGDGSGGSFRVVLLD